MSKDDKNVYDGEISIIRRQMLKETLQLITNPKAIQGVSCELPSFMGASTPRRYSAEIINNNNSPCCVCHCFNFKTKKARRRGEGQCPD
ncbi:hypothetical protein CEXT_279851 [Caerostris extrusa]|uniref:Uncharacterized protein n=1 Tax=Caerostris extrusa TaxID=172846 RepID=A0AAV4XMC1_CAEEX|nr:hypothetical protein CEXT_279851 [Caerostris extrusa]